MKILFCSDGSGPAEDAVRFGALIAGACHAEASILGITEETGREQELLQALRRAQAILKEHQIDAEIIAKAGQLIPEIGKRARENHFDLVVIGAARKSLAGPWWKSTRAYRIIEAIERPVLLVRATRPAFRRMLLCTSGRPQADGMVEFAGELARSVRAVATLCHVLPEPPGMYADLLAREMDAERILASNSKLGRTLRRQKELLDSRGVPCEFRLRHGLVAAEVLKELRKGEYDLVVAGSAPAEDMLRDYVMGDVTREIVNQAELPVLVVRAAPSARPRRLGEQIKRLFHRPGTDSGATPGLGMWCAEECA